MILSFEYRLELLDLLQGIGENAAVGRTREQSRRPQKVVGTPLLLTPDERRA